MANIKRAAFKIPKSELFTYWLTFTQPLHKLPKTNQKVLAELLKLRYEYSFKISDDELLDEFVLSTKNRAIIMDSLKLSTDRFNNILSDLRKSGVLIDNKISNNYIPIIDNKANKYSILFDFIFE